MTRAGGVGTGAFTGASTGAAAGTLLLLQPAASRQPDTMVKYTLKRVANLV